MSDWIWQRTGRNTWRAVTQEQAAQDDRLVVSQFEIGG
jgi:hypothetical protein